MNFKTRTMALVLVSGLALAASSAFAASDAPDGMKKMDDSMQKMDREMKDGMQKMEGEMKADGMQKMEKKMDEMQADGMQKMDGDMKADGMNKMKKEGMKEMEGKKMSDMPAS